MYLVLRPTACRIKLMIAMGGPGLVAAVARDVAMNELRTMLVTSATMNNITMRVCLGSVVAMSRDVSMAITSTYIMVVVRSS